MSSFATAGTRRHHGTNFHWRGLTARVHRRSQVLIHTCTQHFPGLWSTQTQVLFKRSFLGLLQTSNRECLTSVVSQRGHVHLPHQLQPSQSLVLQDCQGMSTGTETRLRASPHQRSCRIDRVSFETRSSRSGHPALVSRAPSHDQRLSTSAHCVHHTLVRAEQLTHGVHLRSLVLTSRHHRSPPHGILHFEEIVIPLPSRLISREMHISTESREQRPCLNNQDPPPPDGKLGTTSKGYPQHKRVRIGET